MVYIQYKDCLAGLKELEDNSIDSIVTDPPYEIGFMGKQWDNTGIAYSVELWKECLRVLKPGGHLLSFGATRSYHRMAVAIEDAGFEIRDSIHWTYGSGFPKSLNVGKAIDKRGGAEREKIGTKQTGDPVNWFSNMDTEPRNGLVDITTPATEQAKTWEGWGTALKPSHEPIVVARKPFVGTVAQNVLTYGTGAINIDESRVGFRSEADKAETTNKNQYADFGSKPVTGNNTYGDYSMVEQKNYTATGRWPANTILTHNPDCVRTGEQGESQIVAGASSIFGSPMKSKLPPTTTTTTTTTYDCSPGCPIPELDRQSGNQASRYYYQTVWTTMDNIAPYIYQPKTSKRERNAGLDGLPEKVLDIGDPRPSGGSWERRTGKKPSLAQNTHPTVKPVALISYLQKLVTPPGGTTLDPFLGSGTSAVSAILNGFEFVGFEITEDYRDIIEGRVAHAHQTVLNPPENAPVATQTAPDVEPDIDTPPTQETLL